MPRSARPDAASGITSLSGRRRILELAKARDREVWFDVHFGTDGPRPDATFTGMLSFADALAIWSRAPGLTVRG